jgi:hypothetical protein
MLLNFHPILREGPAKKLGTPFKDTWHLCFDLSKSIRRFAVPSASVNIVNNN